MIFTKKNRTYNTRDYSRRLRGDSIEDFKIFKFLIIIIIINGLYLTISSAGLTDHKFILYKSHVQKIFFFN